MTSIRTLPGRRVKVILAWMIAVTFIIFWTPVPSAGATGKAGLTPRFAGPRSQAGSPLHSDRHGLSGYFWSLTEDTEGTEIVIEPPRREGREGVFCIASDCFRVS